MKTTYKYLLILTLILYACSSGSDQTPTDEKLPNTTPSVTNTPLPTPIPPQFTDTLHNISGTIIEFWYVWNQAGDDPIQEVIEGFNQSNPYGIQVTAVNLFHLSDIDSGIIERLGTETLPNIAAATPSQYLTWESYGDLIVDLTPYIQDAEVGLTVGEFADLHPILWQQDSINGEHYGIPAERYASAIFYNQTWAQELGFETPPATPEEFREQACAAGNGWMIDLDPDSILSWAYGFNAQIVNENGYTLDTPEMRSVLKFIVELTNNECAWLPNSPFPTDAFIQREGLFYTANTISYPVVEATFQESGSGDRWAVIPFPGRTRPVVTASGFSYVMLQTYPEQQLAAWLLMKYLLEPEVSIQIRSLNSLPLHLSTADEWQVNLLAFAQNEPRLRSWAAVRPALGDAAAQLFDFNFEHDDIPDIVAELQAIADELWGAAGEN